MSKPSRVIPSQTNSRRVRPHGNLELLVDIKKLVGVDQTVTNRPQCQEIGILLSVGQEVGLLLSMMIGGPLMLLATRVTTKDRTPREAYLPFSAGKRVCPGAGFAMAEAAILLAAVMSKFKFEVLVEPVPVAHLTVRARDGIHLRAIKR